MPNPNQRGARSQTQKRIDAIETDGSGGVGENVGKHNERFNQYGTTYNQITDSTPDTPGTHDYNHVEGQRNTIADSSYCHEEGYYNTLSNSSATHVGGYKNNVTGSSYADVGGGENNVGSSSYTDVGGYKNTVTSSAYTAVKGRENTCTSGNYNEMSGYKNSIQNVASCNVSGENNDVRAGKSIVGGKENTLTGQGYAVVGGLENIVTGATGATFGEHNLNNGDGAILCGFYGAAFFNYIGFKLAVGNGSGSSRQNSFGVDLSGNVYAAAYNTFGADYAEFFEWSDGNPDNEFRVGMLVMLDDDKIKPAHGDDILGVVSAAPSVVGNAAELHFRGKYVTDVYGRVITAPNGEPLISPDFDPEREYIPRSKRKEWAAVGLVGRLIVRDIGNCKPGGYAAARRGIAVASLQKTNVKVLRRVDETHVEVLVK